MGGMGGMGGGGGPPQPPPPKPFPGGIKKARTMMKMLRSALTTQKAVAQIKEARGGDGDEPGKRMATLGPVLEGLTKGVCEKFGFQNGFQEAMQSIAAEGGKAQDEKLRSMVEEVGEAITGDKSPRSEHYQPHCPATRLKNACRALRLG
jgi:hypothetical protein